MKTWTEQELKPLIEVAAQKYGLDPAMFFGQLKHESAGFSPAVLAGKRKSSAGAIGIAQFMPGTATGLGVDPLNVPEAIEGGAKYMAQMKKMFDGDEQKARMAYNWGPGNLKKHLRDPDKHPLPAETRDYTKFVAKAAGVDPTMLAGMQPLPAGTRASKAGAGRGSVNPDAQAITQALAAINAGQPPAEPAAPAPLGGPVMAAGDWRDAIPGAGGLAMAGDGDFASALQDNVARNQDSQLAMAFGDVAKPKVDTSGIPSAVDRFLDKLLA